MGEVKECPTCGNLFNFTGVREVCAQCYAKEEELYDVVYKFLRKRENRAANVDRIVEVTGVPSSLLFKWVRKNRLQRALFPNLGYPCDNCGKITNNGKLCEDCQKDLRQNLREFEAAQEFRDKVAENEGSYHSKK